LGTLGKFLSFFFLPSYRFRADWPTDGRGDGRKVIGDFALGTLESFFIFFLLIYKRLDQGGDRLLKPNGDRRRKKILGSLKFWLFIDRYRYEITYVAKGIFIGFD